MGKFWHGCFAVLLLVDCNDTTEVRSPADEAARLAAEKEKAANEATGKTEKSDSDVSDKGDKGEAADKGDKAEAADPSGFDADMSKTILERARKQAVQCPNVVKDTPTGEGDITVVFDGPSGRIVEVNLGSTFSGGSATGQDCIKNAFIGQIVTRFEGKKKVTYALKIAPPDKPEKTDGKKKKP